MEQSLLKDLMQVQSNEYTLTLEAMDIIESKLDKDSKALYVLLTDTGTSFSKIAKMITGQPYNHVSIMLTPSFDEVYTYNLTTTANGLSGGLLKEDQQGLHNSSYSLYKISITNKGYEQVKTLIYSLSDDITQTSYSRLGLVNAIFQKDIFKTAKEAMICSQFVTEVLRAAGIEIFTNKHSSTIRPYDIVKSKMLQFVQRGKINKNKALVIK